MLPVMIRVGGGGAGCGGRENPRERRVSKEAWVKKLGQDRDTPGRGGGFGG